MKHLFLYAIISILVAAAPASAHYIWMEPAGDQSAAPGDTLSLNVYAHADQADGLSFFAVSVGFDDSALGGELTFDSYTLNPDFTPNPVMFPGTYEAGASLAKPGESWIKDIGGMKGFGEFLPVAADSDTLLFSIDFTYSGPEATWSGEDVWLEWNTAMAGAVFWNDAGGVNDIGANGVDYAAVPIPGAALLLGSGLLGLFGIRRRNA